MEAKKFESAKVVLLESLNIYKNKGLNKNLKLDIPYSILLTNIAICYNKLKKNSNALPLIVESVNLKKKILTEEPTNLRKESLALGLLHQSIIYLELENLPDARRSIEQSISLYYQIGANDDKKLLYDLSVGLSTFNQIITRQNESHKMVDGLHNEIIWVTEGLAIEWPERHSTDLACVRLNYARFLSAQGLNEKALDESRKALIIYSEHLKSHPVRFINDYAKCLELYCECAYKLGHVKHAVDNMLDVVSIYRSLANDNSQLYVPPLISAFNRIGLYHFSVRQCEKGFEFMQKGADVYVEAFKKSRTPVEFEIMRIIFTYACDFFVEGKVDTAIKTIEFLLKIFYSGCEYKLQTDIPKNVRKLAADMGEVLKQEGIHKYNQRLDSIIKAVENHSNYTNN